MSAAISGGIALYGQSALGTWPWWYVHLFRSQLAATRRRRRWKREPLGRPQRRTARLNYPCAFCESLKEYCLLVVLWRSNMWARSYKFVPKVCAYGELNIGEFYIANRIPQVGSESNSHSNIMVISGYWFTFDCIMFSIFLDPLKQSKTPGLRITYVQKYPTCTDNGGDNRSNSYSLVALLNLVCWGKK